MIAAVGITSELEGEERPVNEPGFLGGDRTSIDLPAPEEALIAGGEYTISIGGGQPDTGAPGVTGHFRVEGQVDLPE
ncbi:MAG TPA: hypothetical protein VMT20_18610 [Terriglobia bacterium]|nr:hypothetical protein [Terriglobia bacterium]